MTRKAGSLPASYFDELYAADPDPWRFETSDYERGKYAATLAALPGSRYVSGLDVGCSLGVLTRDLAERCDTLLALDPAPAALDRARARCADQPHVSFRQARVPGDWPDGRFDLVLLSEVVYYLDRDDVRRLADRVAAAALPQADVVLVHWTGETDYPLPGDEAAELFIASLTGATRDAERSVRAEPYRIDVLRMT